MAIGISALQSGAGTTGGVQMTDYRADTSLTDPSKHAPTQAPEMSAAGAQGFAADMLGSLPGLADAWKSMGG